jgi:hypothetical protein
VTAAPSSNASDGVIFGGDSQKAEVTCLPPTAKETFNVERTVEVQNLLAMTTVVHTHTKQPVKTQFLYLNIYVFRYKREDRSTYMKRM